AIGGAVGSIASQAVGIAIGAQDGFSWKGVALGAIGGAVSAGLGGANVLPDTGNAFVNGAMRGALGSTITQGVAVVTGLQDKFSWKSVAASAVSAGVSQGLNSAMQYDPKVQFDFGKSFVSGFGGALVGTVVRGGKISGAQIAADAFGNIIGDALAKANNVPGVVSAQEKARILGYFADGPGTGFDLVGAPPARPSANDVAVPQAHMANVLASSSDGGGQPVRFSRGNPVSTGTALDASGALDAINSAFTLGSDSAEMLRAIRVDGTAETWSPTQSLMYSDGNGYPLSKAGLFLDGMLSGSNFTRGMVDSSTLNSEQWMMVNGRLGHLNDNYDSPGLWRDIKTGFDGVFGIQPNDLLTPDLAREKGMLIALQINDLNNRNSNLLGPDFQPRFPALSGLPINPEVWNDTPPATTTIFEAARQNRVRINTAGSSSGWKNLGATFGSAVYNAALAESGQPGPMLAQPNAAEMNAGFATLGAALSIGNEVGGPIVVGGLLARAESVAISRSASSRLEGSTRGLIARSDDLVDGLDMFGRPISARTQKILDNFGNARRVLVEDARGNTSPVLIVEGLGRREVKVSDLGRLQAATGNEFSLFRGPNGERVLLQGQLNELAIPNRYVGNGWKWSGHSHPYGVEASSADRLVLQAFGQEKSVIKGAATGEQRTFTQFQDLSNWLPGR
ncbi:hypothetical protein PMI12_03230, partial [Variovorax sp. CF313]